MKNLKYLLLIACLFVIACGSKDDKTKLTSQGDLNQWRIFGQGTVKITDENAFTLSVPSLAESKGLIFASGEQLPDDYRVSFEFKTNNDKGVLVMLLAFSHVNGGDLVVPDDYDGNWAYFRDGTQHSAYALALHTSAHQPNTFIRKLPGFDLIAQTHDPFDVSGNQLWNPVIIEKRGGNIKIIQANETLLLETNDYKGRALGKGHLAFRLSPAEKQAFIVSYRNVKLEAL